MYFTATEPVRHRSVTERRPPFGVASKIHHVQAPVCVSVSLYVCRQREQPTCVVLRVLLQDVNGTSSDRVRSSGFWRAASPSVKSTGIQVQIPLSVLKFLALCYFVHFNVESESHFNFHLKDRAKSKELQHGQSNRENHDEPVNGALHANQSLLFTNSPTKSRES